MYKLSVTTYALILSLCLNAQNATRLVSPDIQPDNSVIFRLKAPYATSAAVVGTFTLDIKTGIND